MSQESLESRLREHHESLSASDRKFAALLVHRQRDLLTFSATELAEQAGVSKATAARFFRRLGYEDFAAFRLQLREQLPTQSPLHQMNKGARARRPSSLTDEFARHAQDDAARLTTLVEATQAATLQAALSLLSQADSVGVVGYRNSHATAFYAHSLLTQVRRNVSLLNDAAGRESDLLADMGKKDLLLVIDFRRRVRRVAQWVDVCRRAGAQVLLITDAPASTLATQADVVLICPRMEAEIFDSYVPAFSLVNFLATRLARQRSKEVRARLTRIEQLHAQLDDLESH